ncbi:hypothetical protein DFH07DRAFT_949312 [Mycena maculata]|uniref:Uncharacterized protein n=1 Tax=Mycena maculata TaxID=230809 RepID=A0AAD7KG35_9AGAR|nr:hypothetical protein DFH07DRAFT_949312 [Mycena maculata]
MSCFPLVRAGAPFMGSSLVRCLVQQCRCALRGRSPALSSCAPAPSSMDSSRSTVRRHHGSCRAVLLVCDHTFIHKQLARAAVIHLNDVVPLLARTRSVSSSAIEASVSVLHWHHKSSFVLQRDNTFVHITFAAWCLVFVAQLAVTSSRTACRSRARYILSCAVSSLVLERNGAFVCRELALVRLLCRSAARSPVGCLSYSSRDPPLLQRAGVSSSFHLPQAVCEMYAFCLKEIALMQRGKSHICCTSRCYHDLRMSVHVLVSSPEAHVSDPLTAVLVLTSVGSCLGDCLTQTANTSLLLVLVPCIALHVPRCRRGTWAFHLSSSSSSLARRSRDSSPVQVASVPDNAAVCVFGIEPPIGAVRTSCIRIQVISSAVL